MCWDEMRSFGTTRRATAASPVAVGGPNGKSSRTTGSLCVQVTIAVVAALLMLPASTSGSALGNGPSQTNQVAPVTSTHTTPTTTQATPTITKATSTPTQAKPPTGGGNEQLLECPPQFVFNGKCLFCGTGEVISRQTYTCVNLAVALTEEHIPDGPLFSLIAFRLVTRNGNTEVAQIPTVVWYAKYTSLADISGFQSWLNPSSSIGFVVVVGRVGQSLFSGMPIATVSTFISLTYSSLGVNQTLFGIIQDITHDTIHKTSTFAVKNTKFGFAYRTFDEACQRPASNCKWTYSSSSGVTYRWNDTIEIAMYRKLPGQLSNLTIMQSLSNQPRHFYLPFIIENRIVRISHPVQAPTNLIYRQDNNCVVLGSPTGCCGPWVCSNVSTATYNAYETAHHARCSTHNGNCPAHPAFCAVNTVSKQCVDIEADASSQLSTTSLPRATTTVVTTSQPTTSKVEGPPHRVTTTVVTTSQPTTTYHGSGSAQVPISSKVAVSVTCPDPPHILAGKRNISSFQVGGKVMYACLPGYELLGTSDFLCSPAGTWDIHTLPNCTENLTIEEDPSSNSNNVVIAVASTVGVLMVALILGIVVVCRQKGTFAHVVFNKSRDSVDSEMIGSKQPRSTSTGTIQPLTNSTSAEISMGMAEGIYDVVPSSSSIPSIGNERCSNQGKKPVAICYEDLSSLQEDLGYVVASTPHIKPKHTS